MMSERSLATNQNKQLSDRNVNEGFNERLIQAVIVSLLAATAFIHWYLPVIHPVEMPGELTGGIIVISHDLLHLLFDLNGVGYFVLVASVATWLPLWSNHRTRLYSVVAGYSGLTILAWFLLSSPADRNILDYTDKLIELGILALAVWMRQRLAATIGD